MSTGCRDEGGWGFGRLSSLPGPHLPRQRIATASLGPLGSLPKLGDPFQPAHGRLVQTRRIVFLVILHVASSTDRWRAVFPDEHSTPSSWEWLAWDT